jgi:hypothetical protein
MLNSAETVFSRGCLQKWKQKGVAAAGPLTTPR